MMVNSVETLQKKIAQVRAAQEQFAKFTQEQVDEIFFQVSMAANQARIQLAKMAVEETGIGVAEDKVIKNHYASEYIYNAYKDVKTCGIIEKDDAFGITKIAEPIGVLAGIIPTTNPTSTDGSSIQPIIPSGAPALTALGVGSGNTPIIFDESCDIKVAVSSVIHSKTFDNGTICASEQSVIVDASIYEEVKQEFRARKAYIAEGEELVKLKKIVLGANGSMNAKLVGRPAIEIAQEAGFNVPADTKLIIGEATSTEISEPLAHA